MKKYIIAWVTLLLFLIAWTIFFLFGKDTLFIENIDNFDSASVSLLKNNEFDEEYQSPDVESMTGDDEITMTWDDQTIVPKKSLKDLQIQQNVKDYNYLKSIQTKPFIQWDYFFLVIYWIWLEQEFGWDLTDIIKIVAINTKTKDAIVLWLPRDWIVNYDNEEMKVNYIFDHNVKKWMSKRDSLRETTIFLSQYLQVPIHYYISVDFAAFEDFVDAVWWVEVTVDKDIKWYGEPFLSSGTHMLNWEQALKLARTRKQDNDFLRILRQNELLFSLAKQVKSLKMNTIPSLVTIFLSKVNTNLNLWEMIYLYFNYNDIGSITEVVLNSQCKFYSGQFSEYFKFCFFKEDKVKKWLVPFTDIATIRHYIKTIIKYPELYGCDIEWRFDYNERINLMNVWVHISKLKLRKEFTITKIEGCTMEAINYFMWFK